jgi:hypothetical protein
MRVIDFFDRGVNLDAEAPCLSDLGAPPASHRGVAQSSHAIAAGLLELGITPETKIAIYSPIENGGGLLGLEEAVCAVNILVKD